MRVITYRPLTQPCTLLPMRNYQLREATWMRPPTMIAHLGLWAQLSRPGVGLVHPPCGQLVPSSLTAVGRLQHCLSLFFTNWRRGIFLHTSLYTNNFIFTKIESWERLMMTRHISQTCTVAAWSQCGYNMHYQLKVFSHWLTLTERYLFLISLAMIALSVRELLWRVRIRYPRRLRANPSNLRLLRYTAAFVMRYSWPALSLLKIHFVWPIAQWL